MYKNIVNFLIRVDAGGSTGLGHIMRCLAIGSSLRSRGIKVIFCGNRTAIFEKLLRHEGYEAVFNDEKLGEETFLLNVVRSKLSALLFIDHLHPYARDYIATLRQYSPIVFLHNDCEGILSADAVVFPIGHLDPTVKNMLSEGCNKRPTFAVGFDYVVIRKEVQTAVSAQCQDKPYLVLTTGGSDPHGLLFRFLDWIAQSNWPYPVKALVGQDFIDRKKLDQWRKHCPRFIEVSAFDYHKLLGARLAVSAFGVTPYELIYGEVPVITVGFDAKSTQGSDRLSVNSGASISLGSIEKLDAQKFLQVINWAWSNPTHRALQARQRGLIDGKGVVRITDLMMKQCRS